MENNKNLKTKPKTPKAAPKARAKIKKVKSKIHFPRDERTVGVPPEVQPGLNPTTSEEQRTSSNQRNAPGSVSDV